MCVAEWIPETNGTKVYSQMVFLYITRTDLYSQFYRISWNQYPPTHIVYYVLLSIQREIQNQPFESFSFIIRNCRLWWYYYFHTN